MNHDLLETITSLSREFGAARYVKGGGGNSSCKDDDTLWIKPSGTVMAELTPQKFIAMDRSRLHRLYSIAPPDDAKDREALVKDIMAAAVKPETPGRASVEAPVHHAFRARFVVHTHPTLANGLACALAGHEAAERMFPEMLWLPYVDPGYRLGMKIRDALNAYRERKGYEPKLTWIANHGVFVAAHEADQVRATYNDLMSRLEEAYRKADISPTSPPPTAQPDPGRIEQYTTELRAAFGKDAAAVLPAPPRECAAGPITPDHLVYAKAYVYEGAMQVSALRGWANRRGYVPRVVSRPDALLALGSNAKTAQLALEFAQDAADIRRLSRAFGGIQYLSDNAREFLEGWEVEAYRARQLADAT